MRFKIFLLLSILTFAGVSPVFSATNAGKEQWTSVRTKNFFLIGDASEKEIRRVATKLEQFREVFRRLFATIKLESAIQTNVVVFKNEKSYEPFLPRLANGKADKRIAGYFQGGEDVNYITLSTEGESADTYGTIFHEYVHYIVDTNFGRSSVPPWFNEGLAEYYQTFSIRDDRIVNLGEIQPSHIYLLQQSKFIPFDDLFNVTYYSLHQNGHNTRSVFYAQSWALMHYLLQGNKGARRDQLGKFLNLLLTDKPPKQAFTEAFNTDYATMEKELRDYIGQSRLMMTQFTFKDKLTFETEMQSKIADNAEFNAYLGDLLYHTHRYEDAEVYLQKALAEDANSSLANTALGLVKMRQRKFDEAKQFLEKAVNANQKNHFAHYQYAYVLSREGMGETGLISGFSAETAKKMRDSLQKAIQLQPAFSESYRLLAFVNMVRDEQLDEALGYLRKALTIQPGNQWYAFDIAQLYYRKEEFQTAAALAETLVKTATEPRLKSSAQSLFNSIKNTQAQMARYEEMKKQAEKDGKSSPILIRQNANGDNGVAQTPEEAINVAINEALRKPKANEKRVLGFIEKIECDAKGVTFNIKSDSQLIKLLNKQLENLYLMAFTPGIEGMNVGCGADLSKYKMVITYLPTTDAKVKHHGELVALEFVSKEFKLNK